MLQKLALANSNRSTTEGPKPLTPQPYTVIGFCIFSIA